MRKACYFNTQSPALRLYPFLEPRRVSTATQQNSRASPRGILYFVLFRKQNQHGFLETEHTYYLSAGEKIQNKQLNKKYHLSHSERALVEHEAVRHGLAVDDVEGLLQRRAEH